MSDFRSGKRRPKDRGARATIGVRRRLLSATALLVAAGPAFADCSGQPQAAGTWLGASSPDFIDASHTVSIGDIRGAVGVQILSQHPNGFHVHHHWVN